MDMQGREPEVTEYLPILWKRKRAILLATCGLAALAGAISLVLPPVWEVDMVVQPSRLLIQTREGKFEDFYVADARQMAGQIEQKAYDAAIAGELRLELRDFPALRADNLRDTKLLRVSLRAADVERGKAILRSLFERLKADMDGRVEVELKALAAAIDTGENNIKQKRTDIESKEIEIALSQQEIRSMQRKLQISEERVQSLGLEMKGVKARIDDIEREQKNALAETKRGGDAIGLLLYANEVQQNLRYYNSLDEKLSMEKIAQENLRMQINAKEQEIKQHRIAIEKLNREIDMIRTEIDLHRERMRRIDHARMIKEPTETVNPVWPKKTLVVLSAAMLGLIVSSAIAIALDRLYRQA